MYTVVGWEIDVGRLGRPGHILSVATNQLRSIGIPPNNNLPATTVTAG